MVDNSDVTKVVKSVLSSSGFKTNDLSKKPSDLLSHTSAEDGGRAAFIVLLGNIEQALNQQLSLNIKWPKFLPLQDGQPFASVYFYKSLSDLIWYLSAYINKVQNPYA